MEPSRVTLEEAQELFQICMPGIKKEEKPAADCLGQILAEPVYAAVTQPPFPRSAMDGFALRSRDVCGADLEHPVTLEVAGCVYAGQKTELILEPHQAVRIMTGAMIPEGADCVVKQEDTDYVRIADPDQDRKLLPERRRFFCRGIAGRSRTFGGFLSAGGSYVCGSTGHYCI